MSRIVYVCADRGIPVFGEKGASIHVQEMIRAFEALGHEVRVICLKRGEGGGDLGRVTVEAVAPPPVSDTGRAAKEHQAIAAAEAIERRLIELHAEWPFDLVYERYSLWSAAGCRAARRIGVPCVVEVNAPLVREQEEYRQLELKHRARALEREVFSTAGLLAAVSRQLSGYLTTHGARQNRVHVIGNAVDTGAFHPDVRPARIDGVGADRFVIGFTGSLKMWHGIDTLLQAFRSFRTGHPDAHLLIVGDGPKRGWAEGFVAGAGLERDVTFTGWVPHGDLPGLIARMDVATAPYPESEDHYFSPLKLYEYLAMGRPVIASRIGQCADLLDGSEAARLVAPGDARALVETLAELHAAPGLRRKMALAAAEQGRRHDWQENARRVIELAEQARAAA